MAASAQKHLSTFGVVPQTAADRDNRPNGAFCRTVGLVRIRHRGLLLDAFILVEDLERVGCKLTCSIVTNELDLLAELGLDLDDVGLDTVFALRLVT